MKAEGAAAVAALIDHTLLKPTATGPDILRLCNEALTHCFHSVCVNPHFIRLAREHLVGSSVKITTVVGFPLGMTLTEVKVYEAMHAALRGAHELDVVINIGALKSGDLDTVRKDLRDIAAATPDLLHKAIIEACFLSDEEKQHAVRVATDAGFAFVKTSTGFGPSGATAHDVALMLEAAKGKAAVKAAGGINTLSKVREMLDAGATRIGASSSVSIVQEADK